MERKPRYGEIWTVDLGEGKTHESYGVKPCIIISAAFLNKGGNIVIAPICYKDAPLDSHVKVQPRDLGTKVSGFTILEHIRGISSERLGKKIGNANKYMLTQINTQLLRVFNMEDIVNQEVPKKKPKGKPQGKPQKRR